MTIASLCNTRKADGNALGQIPHVHAAAQRGLGTDDQDYINLIDVALL